MLKRLQIKWLLIGIPVLLVAFAFYWIAVRPVLAKQACSWTSYIEPAKEAFAGITQDDAERTNAQNKKDNSAECATTTGLDTLFLECKPTNVRAQSPRPSEPAREVKRSATKAEYEQCLRHRGLF